NIFIHDKENPKRAMLARFDYQMMKMQNPELWDDVVKEYIVILRDIKYNNDIDLFELKKVLELPILKNSPNYDELFEKLLELLGEQSKNLSSSQLLINRGNDYLETDVYTSIKYYSRALSKLYQEESKIDLIKLLLSLGTAFERIGLAWSARSYYVRAYMNSFNLYFDEGIATPGIFLSARSIKMLELGLGRLDYSLEMNELELQGIDLYPYETNEYEELEKYSYYDGLLANYLLNLSLEESDILNTLPDYLNDAGLHTSSAAIKYKLGYYDEDYLEVLGSNKKVDSFMKNLYTQPASKSFQKGLNSEVVSNTITLRTKIIGCDVTVTSKRNRIKEELGATIFAMLENIFATSVVDKIMPMLGTFSIEILDGEEKTFNIEVQQNENAVQVIISQIDELIEFTNREIVFEKMYSIVAIFISQMLVFERDFQKFKETFEKESTMFRCFNHSSTLDTFLVYADSASIFSEHRKKYNNQRDFDVFKNQPLDGNVVSANVSEIKMMEEFDLTKITHRNIQTSEVIYLPLWNKADWKGVLAIPEKIISNKPYLGLVFRNDAGVSIFSKWENDNVQNKIVIGIITGISRKHPYWYRVIIGENMFNQELYSSPNNQLFGVTTRLHTMEASDEKTISILKQIIAKNKEFSFIPVLEEDLETNTLRTELSFVKDTDSIILKDVSEIGEKDYFLHQGILPIDDPVNLTKEERFIEAYIKEKKKIN
ncbi:hypothetical protein K4925_002934, partial [Enterococcus faecalis]|nr:hypothetical protein [Enterococcus faecalis]